MLRTLRARRRPRYGWHLCAVMSALLLLFSVSLLHTRLSQNDSVHSSHHSSTHQYDYELDSIQQNPLLSDDNDSPDSQDKIDELDDDDRSSASKTTDAEEDQEPEPINKTKKTSNSLYYMDHVTGSIRRALNKRSIEEWDYDYSGTASFLGGFSKGENEAKGAFGSDDLPIDEEVRGKIGLVESVEDALLLKLAGVRASPLRDGWGDWFEKKGDFLRRDKMFRSNLEVLNPLSNPMLQDPDGVGVTGLTRGDKAVHKWLLSEIRKAPPFLVKKPLSIGEDHGGKHGNLGNGNVKEVNSGNGAMNREDKRVKEVNLGKGLFSRKLDNEVRKVEERNLDSVVLGKRQERKLGDRKGKEFDLHNGREIGNVVRRGEERVKVVPEELRHVSADGRRWGYFPGLDPRLSFSEFMDLFFRRGECGMRVFMVWNSPPSMFGVRHQRGIESLFSLHRDACVVVLSETIELDFFKDSFVKDGYRVAVAMPNLDELLKDTPTHVFSSLWFQQRKTKFYPIHYSELVRLAVLYKYGGIYLDSDIIVLNSLSSLNDMVGLEDQIDETSLNGAVMVFRKHSHFIKECLKEFYVTYDDTRLKWNGADLLTRVARNSSIKQNGSFKPMGFKVQPSYVFFPISSKDITRYFTKPATEDEWLRQDAIFEKVISESLAFHFWNRLTSARIPEPGSLVARLIDHSCIHCHDML